MSQYYHHRFLGTRFHHSEDKPATESLYDKMLRDIDQGKQPGTLREQARPLPKASTETEPPRGIVDRARRWLLGTDQQK